MLMSGWLPQSAVPLCALPLRSSRWFTRAGAQAVRGALAIALVQYRLTGVAAHDHEWTNLVANIADRTCLPLIAPVGKTKYDRYSPLPSGFSPTRAIPSSRVEFVLDAYAQFMYPVENDGSISTGNTVAGSWSIRRSGMISSRAPARRMPTGRVRAPSGAFSAKWRP